MDRKFRGLHLNHVEVDEIWTFVAKKQARLTVEEKETCHDIEAIYHHIGADREKRALF